MKWCEYGPRACIQKLYFLHYLWMDQKAAVFVPGKALQASVMKYSSLLGVHL
jgi:hypothetical protein